MLKIMVKNHITENLLKEFEQFIVSMVLGVMENG